MIDKDLVVVFASAVVAGRLKPDIDVHRTSRFAQVLRQCDVELEAVFPLGTQIVTRSSGFGPIDQHKHPLDAHG